MGRRTLLFDEDECIGCFACEVACKQEHHIPTGEHWIRILKVGPTRIGARLSMRFVAVHCRHCGKPPCMSACPVNAVSRRSDGVVLFNEEVCIGCQACVEACPFGVPQVRVEKNTVGACNLCFERTDRGLKPSCVHHCPTRALTFGDPNDLASRRVEEGLEQKGESLTHERRGL